MYKVERADQRAKNLRRMVSAVRDSLTDAPSVVAGLANASAFIMAYMPALNWAGFYLMQAGRLTLGPFQGMPACTEIALGSGVCGTAAHQRRTLVVDDVEAFPGHIACDSASRSELVVPVVLGGAVYGVIDLDSPEPGRFGPPEAEAIEAIAALLERWLADCTPE